MSYVCTLFVVMAQMNRSNDGYHAISDAPITEEASEPEDEGHAAGDEGLAAEDNGTFKAFLSNILTVMNTYMHIV